uniref:hypothetical protein n=1 Tax=Saccharicrinis aurantiacus TaxID=1849719 RepID=UPI0015C56F08
LKRSIKAEELGKNIKKGLSESLKAIGGVNMASKLKNELKELKDDLQEQEKKTEDIYEYAKGVTEERNKLREHHETAKRAVKENKVLKTENNAQKIKIEEYKERMEMQHTAWKKEKKMASSWANLTVKMTKEVLSGNVGYVKEVHEMLLRKGIIEDNGRNNSIKR